MADHVDQLPQLGDDYGDWADDEEIHAKPDWVEGGDKASGPDGIEERPNDINEEVDG